MKSRLNRIQFNIGVIITLAALCLNACALVQGAQGGEPAAQPAATDATGMPNPASVYCEEQGFTLEIRTAEDGSQQGVCIFPDGGECDEWAYYRGECGPGSQGEPVSTPAPNPAPGIDTTGWSAYTHPAYGFSFRYPPEWALEEVQEADNTMSGRQIRLSAQTGDGQPVRLLVSFKRTGEDQLIWPTGVGEGEFVQRGTLLFLGQEIERNVLVCQEKELRVYYQQAGGVRRGDLEFSFILDTPGNCQDALSLPAGIQQAADAIVESFELQE